MNWDQFKLSLCYLCLCSAMPASLLFTQEALDSNTIFYNFLVNFVEFLQDFMMKNSTVVSDKNISSHTLDVLLVFRHCRY